MRVSKNRVVVFTDGGKYTAPDLELNIVDGGVLFRGYPYDLGQLNRTEIIKLVAALNCYLETGHFRR